MSYESYESSVVSQKAHLMTQHWFFLVRRMLKKQASAMAKT